MDNDENENMRLIDRSSNEDNQLEQDLITGENISNKFLFEFEDFDLSTLTNGEHNFNSTNVNSPEKLDYLMRQEDAKCILKWHFGVKLFRAWIENKNAPIRQKLFQRKEMLFIRD